MLFGFVRRVSLVAALIAPNVGLASDWAILNEPGVVGLMRHALAPGTGDPSGFRLDDCSTQRNLDARGRSQAGAIGEKLRAEAIRIDHVLSSAWCRCRETAERLGVASVEIAPELNSFYQARESGAGQTVATRALIERLEGPALLVTHQVNITALTGVYPSSGEIVVLRLADGAVTVLDRLVIDP
ncbi:histidine phosphatase family protein [Tropicimonas sp. TH_r6]|uniref:histidine phosphatase family protein n=1 Tax=Tropicimonas sp. TH_r6 TaxID=3082085 RepID=UPI002954BF5E|nr:histidine phosphatase family protein [Tropicimonas sp. TH_r6]MDV7145766.1 histidine phosphatase family protein [Tropicimonas sp. TH_r6]